MLSCTVLLVVPNALAAPVDVPGKKQSSYELMSAENKAMQDDPTLNPAMFWVSEGESLWQTKSGTKNIACSQCHSDIKKSMRGVATQYPKMMKVGYKLLKGRLINAEKVSKTPQLQPMKVKSFYL